jgi:hypothetical protein
LTPKDTIVLADLPFVPGKMSAQPCGGALIVSNGTNSVSLKTGGPIVVDPPSSPSPPARKIASAPSVAVIRFVVLSFFKVGML